MQKKIIALAIAAAISTPAFADTTVYGKLSADFESVKTTAVTLPLVNATSVSRVATNASRFGVKGAEDLGDGLSAVYQYEVQMDLNGAGGNGLGNGTRNSNVGLKGDFGTVALGIWDTPYKVAHNKNELFDNTTFASATNVLGRVGAGSFNTRLANSVQYWTPNLNGFSAAVSYGADNTQLATKNASMVSLSGAYENDMFYAAYAYQSLKDSAYTNAAVATALGNKTDGNRVVGAFKFEGGQVGLTYEQLNATAAGVKSTRNAWELMGAYKMGANNFGLSYTKAGNLGAAVNTGAKQLSLRYGYQFSKRTEAFAMYSALTNDAAGTFNTNAGNIITGSATGAKLTGFGAGLVHTF